MNQVFDAYAAYYDLLYRDKDYAAEVAYVDGLIRHHAPEATEILELGCGTGAHAMELANHGYRITGIDRSEAMVRQANERAARFPEYQQRLAFLQGDLRTFRAGRSFDVVLALFHVMSYQTSNEDLQEAFATVGAHLKPGGLFIFDCWYGPGVLSDPPTTRVRRLQGDEITVTRIAEPVHLPNENRVDVHYEVLVEGPVALKRIQELHSMRYLFSPEVNLLMLGAGLRCLALEAWLSGCEPDTFTWNVCFVAIR